MMDCSMFRCQAASRPLYLNKVRKKRIACKLCRNIRKRKKQGKKEKKREEREGERKRRRTNDRRIIVWIHTWRFIRTVTMIALHFFFHKLMCETIGQEPQNRIRKYIRRMRRIPQPVLRSTVAFCPEHDCDAFG